MSDFDEYQSQARKTAIYPEAGSGSFNAVAYAVLGLTNEAGEVAGKLKKIWRDADGKLDREARYAIAQELGDVLWYWVMVVEEIGFDASHVSGMNLTKLFSRQERGVIGGSGDNR